MIFRKILSILVALSFLSPDFAQARKFLAPASLVETGQDSRIFEPPYETEPLSEELMGRLPGLTIGERFAAVREERGDKQSELRRRADIPSATYSYMERRDALPSKMHHFFNACKELKIDPMLIIKGKFWEDVKDGLKDNEKMRIYRQRLFKTEKAMIKLFEKAGMDFETDDIDTKRVNITNWEKGRSSPTPYRCKIIRKVFGDKSLYPNIQLKSLGAVFSGSEKQRKKEKRETIEKIKAIIAKLDERGEKGDIESKIEKLKQEAAPLFARLRELKVNTEADKLQKTFDRKLVAGKTAKADKQGGEKLKKLEKLQTEIGKIAIDEKVEVVLEDIKQKAKALLTELEGQLKRQNYRILRKQMNSALDEKEKQIVVYKIKQLIGQVAEVEIDEEAEAKYVEIEKEAKKLFARLVKLKDRKNKDRLEKKLMRATSKKRRLVAKNLKILGIQKMFSNIPIAVGDDDLASLKLKIEAEISELEEDFGDLVPESNIRELKELLSEKMKERERGKLNEKIQALVTRVGALMMELKKEKSQSPVNQISNIIADIKNLGEKDLADKLTVQLRVELKKLGLEKPAVTVAKARPIRKPRPRPRPRLKPEPKSAPEPGQKLREMKAAAGVSAVPRLDSKQTRDAAAVEIAYWLNSRFPKKRPYHLLPYIAKSKQWDTVQYILSEKLTEKDLSAEGVEYINKVTEELFKARPWLRPDKVDNIKNPHKNPVNRSP